MNLEADHVRRRTAVTASSRRGQKQRDHHDSCYPNQTDGDSTDKVVVVGSWFLTLMAARTALEGAARAP